MANENEVKITIDVSQAKAALNDLLATTTKLNNSLANDTSKKIKEIGTEGGISFGKLAGAIGLATGAYELAAEAARKLVEIVKEGIGDYIKEESFYQRIGGAMKNNALLTERMIRLRDELNKNPLFTKDQINNAVEFAASLGRNEKQTRELIIAAQGLSRLTGEDLNNSVSKLNGTYNGVTGRLNKYIDGIKGLSKEQMANGKIVELAAAQLGKYGDMAGKTETGIAEMNKRWTETKESIGAKLVPVINVLLKLLNEWWDYVEKVGGAVGRLGTRLYDFLTKYFKPLITIVEQGVKVFKFLSTAVGDFYIWLDKVTETSAEKRVRQEKAIHGAILEELNKTKDAYSKADEKGKKEIIEREKKFIEEQKKLGTANAKVLVTIHEQMLKDFKKMDEEKPEEEDPAEAKKREEAAKKALEEKKRLLKEEFDLKAKAIQLDEETSLKQLELAGATAEQIYDTKVDFNNKSLQAVEEYNNKFKTLNKGQDSPEYLNQIKELNNKKLQAQIDFGKAKNDINDTQIANSEKKLKEQIKKEQDAYAALKTTYEGYLDSVNKGKVGNLNLKETIQQVEQIKQKFIQAQNAHKAYQQSLLDSGKITKEEFDKDIAEIDKETQAFADKSKESVDNVKQNVKDVEQNIKQAAGELAGKVINGIFDNLTAQLQKNLEKTLEQIDKVTNKEQGNLDKLLKKKYISEAEYNKRKEKLDKEKEEKDTAAKRENAKKQKKYAEEQALINALLGATMALATTTPTFPLGLIMAGIVLALGMADVALIAAAPLQYKQGGIVPSFAAGGFTSPYGDQNGIPSILHPGEGILNSTAMSAPGMPQMVDSANKGQPVQQQTSIHPDSVKAIINGINDKQVVVSQYDIQKQNDKVKVLQGRSTL